MSAVPSESAIHRRATSLGLRVQRIGEWQDNRFMLIDIASGIVVRKELDIEELVDVLAAY